jgi:hypothetical protein
MVGAKPFLCSLLAPGLGIVLACHPGRLESPQHKGTVGAAEGGGSSAPVPSLPQNAGALPSRAATCWIELGPEVQLFARTVQFHPPVGVEEFIESSPVFARMVPEPAGYQACPPEAKSLEITFGAAGSVADDPEASLAEIARTVLRSIDYPENVQAAGVVTAGAGEFRSYRSRVDIPAAPEAGFPHPARAWLVLRSGYGRVVWLLWETRLEAWSELQGSFESSGESLRCLNPDTTDPS